MPSSSLRTGDSVSAQASIIFDTEETVATNIWTNIVDAVAPTSKLNNLPAAVDYAFVISWSGKDDSLGSGVKYYDVYVSRNNGPFTLYQEKLDTTATSFTGDPGATYSLYTIATDNTGNREAAKTTGDQTVTVKGYGVYVSIKAFLQGAYNSSAGLMTDSLRTKALLPVSDPYPSLGFIPVNNFAAKNISTGVFDSTGNKAITDWVWLELRKASNASEIVSSRAALIRRDGNVVDMDGVSPVYFNNIPEGGYYIAIRHRNHLGVMTATTVSFYKTNSTTIDFTNPITATYGTNAQRNVSGVMAMWGGDVNGNKQIRYNGSSNDKNAVLAKVGLVTANNIVTAYDRADVNLDGRIRYNGSGNDKNIILSSVGLTTPNNIIIEQLPNL